MRQEVEVDPVTHGGWQGVARFDPVVPRHPLDPDPVPSTKARAAFALGIVAVCTAVVVGGVVPAFLALVLAREARAEMHAAQGYLTGGRFLVAAERLAYAGLGIALIVLVVLAVNGILQLAPPAA